MEVIWMMWELIGAVVGAGFASGREIAAFFASYGVFGYAGIAAAGAVICILGTVQQPIQWRFRWMEQIWRILLAAMLITTASSMLAGAGEIAGLILPIKGADWNGVAATYALAWLLARKSIHGFSRISRVLLITLCGMIIAVLLDGRQERQYVIAEGKTGWLASGLRYGGFNAALQIPILEGWREPSEKKRCVLKASLVFCILVALGTTLLLRHPGLIAEPMPFLKAVSSWGRGGYGLFALCLYLAILSTLIACFKGIRGMAGMLAVLALSRVGFTWVVDHLYPLLGCGCFVMLICAKFMKCGTSPFHSSADVL